MVLAARRRFVELVGKPDWAVEKKEQVSRVSHRESEIRDANAFSLLELREG